MSAVNERSTGAVPISVVVLSALGAISLAAGVVGLVAPEVAPPLAGAAVAWSLIGVGVIMDVLAVTQLMAARPASRKS